MSEKKPQPDGRRCKRLTGHVDREGLNHPRVDELVETNARAAAVRRRPLCHTEAIVSLTSEADYVYARYRNFRVACVGQANFDSFLASHKAYFCVAITFKVALSQSGREDVWKSFLSNVKQVVFKGHVPHELFRSVLPSLPIQRMVNTPNYVDDEKYVDDLIQALNPETTCLELDMRSFRDDVAASYIVSGLCHVVENSTNSKLTSVLLKSVADGRAAEYMLDGIQRLTKYVQDIHVQLEDMSDVDIISLLRQHGFKMLAARTVDNKFYVEFQRHFENNVEPQQERPPSRQALTYAEVVASPARSRRSSSVARTPSAPPRREDVSDKKSNVDGQSQATSAAQVSNVDVPSQSTSAAQALTVDVPSQATSGAQVSNVDVPSQSTWGAKAFNAEKKSQATAEATSAPQASNVEQKKADGQSSQHVSPVKGQGGTEQRQQSTLNDSQLLAHPPKLPTLNVAAVPTNVDGQPVASSSVQASLSPDEVAKNFAALAANERKKENAVASTSVASLPRKRFTREKTKEELEAEKKRDGPQVPDATRTRRPSPLRRPSTNVAQPQQPNLTSTNVAQPQQPNFTSSYVTEPQQPNFTSSYVTEPQQRNFTSSYVEQPQQQNFTSSYMTGAAQTLTRGQGNVAYTQRRGSPLYEWNRRSGDYMLDALMDPTQGHVNAMEFTARNYNVEDPILFGAMNRKQEVTTLTWHERCFEAVFSNEDKFSFSYERLHSFFRSNVASRHLVIRQTYRNTKTYMERFAGMSQAIRGFMKLVRSVDVAGVYNMQQMESLIGEIVDLEEMVHTRACYDIVGNLSLLFKFISLKCTSIWYDGRESSLPRMIDILHAFVDQNMEHKRNKYDRVFLCGELWPVKADAEKAISLCIEWMKPDSALTLLTNQPIDDHLTKWLVNGGFEVTHIGSYYKSPRSEDVADYLLTFITMMNPNEKPPGGKPLLVDVARCNVMPLTLNDGVVQLEFGLSKFTAKFDNGAACERHVDGLFNLLKKHRAHQRIHIQFNEFTEDVDIINVAEWKEFFQHTFHVKIIGYVPIRALINMLHSKDFNTTVLTLFMNYNLEEHINALDYGVCGAKNLFLDFKTSGMSAIQILRRMARTAQNPDMLQYRLVANNVEEETNQCLQHLEDFTCDLDDVSLYVVEWTNNVATTLQNRGYNVPGDQVGAAAITEFAATERLGLSKSYVDLLKTTYEIFPDQTCKKFGGSNNNDRVRRLYFRGNIFEAQFVGGEKHTTSMDHLMDFVATCKACEVFVVVNMPERDRDTSNAFSKFAVVADLLPGFLEEVRHIEFGGTFNSRHIQHWLPNVTNAVIVKMRDFQSDGGRLKDVVELLPNNVDVFYFDARGTAETSFLGNLTYFYEGAKRRPKKFNRLCLAVTSCPLYKDFVDSLTNCAALISANGCLTVITDYTCDQDIVNWMNHMRFQGPFVGEYAEKPGCIGIKKYYVWCGKIARSRVQVAFSVE
uniref:Uncharacterized protein n=1 Tax=Panagrolaimus sp. JU765 TaxID=591449 RepID=A0AC34RG89_9BILA